MKFLKSFLRSILQSSFVPHPVKYLPWAMIKFFKLQALENFSVKFPDGSFMQMKGTEVHFQLWYWWGLEAHEYDTVKILMALGKVSRSFWDVGAYFGQYSLYLSKINPSLQILGFEPNPDVSSKFREQIALNSMNNITISPLAISDKAGKFEFYNQKNNSSNSSLSLKRKSGAEIIEVDVKPLDDVATDLNVPHLDLVKIDVEHNELNVLRGMKNIIHQYRPMIVMEVLKTFPNAEAEAILAPEGYAYFYITYDGLIKTDKISRPAEVGNWRLKQRTPYYNFLFCPLEKIADLKKTCTVL